MSSGVTRRVLVVDDDVSIRRLLRVVLQDEYLLEEARSGEEALEKLMRWSVGVVLLDLLMPGIDGFETCRRIKAERSDVQVIIVSATSSARQQLRAIEAGADDYMVKPFDGLDLRSRVRLHFQLQEAMANAAAIRAEIECRNTELRQLSEQRVLDIIALQDTAVFTLAKVAESRDPETGGHLSRMRTYSQILAEDLAEHGPYMSWVDKGFLDDLYRSSPLHDIGKVGVRDEILLKPGPLAPEEYEAMKQHTVLGAEILDQAVADSRGGGFLAMAALIARHHHERFDGTGYPAGLAGNGIPLPARIVALADVYDALTSVRPYKPAFPPQRAKKIIVRDSGTHFDPVIVAAFERCFDSLLCVRVETPDEFRFAHGPEYAERSSGAEPLTV